jgi:hypothetical protein
MKITYVVTECRDKVSQSCTKTFNREVKRGRPQVNCDACKAHKAPAAPKVNISETGQITVDLTRECPCGKKFEIRPGRGRKATKCDDCRSNGTVYRMDEDGELQAIRAEALAEEQRELREQAGRERSAALIAMMAPLIRRDEERRAAYRKTVAAI